MAAQRRWRSIAVSAAREWTVTEMYEELVKRLRGESEYADLVAYMHGIRPISPEDATAEIAGSWKELFAKAADAIEELVGNSEQLDEPVRITYKLEEEA